MGRRSDIGLLIDVINHNLRTGKVDMNRKNVSQSLDVPKNLKKDWEAMGAAKGKRAAASKAKAASKTTAKATAAKKNAAKVAPHQTARGRKLTALARIYAHEEGGMLYGENDGKSDLAVDEVIAHILETHGKPDETEALIDWNAVEAVVEDEFEQIESDLDDNRDEDDEEE